MSGLKTGYTTGACASAAAKAAVVTLVSGGTPSYVEIPLPGGARAGMDVVEAELTGNGARAAVIKDSGDDPDITNGAKVVAGVLWMEQGGVTFEPGEGIGTVTRPGLSIPPGEAAINPVPRSMITEAVREITDRHVLIRLSIPGGEKLAARTFNPRLGVMGGLSILGTTGIVRPYSCPAIRKSIECMLDVTLASGVTAPVFTPGAIGSRAAANLFDIDPRQVVEVGNEWGHMIDVAAGREIEAILAAGHPGKLAKLAAGHWDTHSKNSPSAVPYVVSLAKKERCNVDEDIATVEGVLNSIPPIQRRQFADRLSKNVAQSITKRIGDRFGVSVALVNMKSELTGFYGDTGRWIRR